MRSDTERAVKLALFFKEGYENGRQATAVSAGIRHYFAAALKSVDWFESQIVASARAACRLSCDELREQKKEAKSKATLPVSEDMLSAARVRLWASKGWGWGDVDERMTYVGLMWGFDQVARVSEYTLAETAAEDHCVRLWRSRRHPRSHTRRSISSENGCDCTEGCRGVRSRGVASHKGGGSAQQEKDNSVVATGFGESKKPGKDGKLGKLLG